MVRDGRHATESEDGSERQRVKEHVRLMLRKLISKSQKPSDHKRPE
jgi:hypothetical protein